MEQAIIKVNGMTCGHCEAAVVEALKKLAGVEKAKVNLEKGVAAVLYDPAATSIEEMKAAIAAAGFEAESVESIASEPQTGGFKFSKLDIAESTPSEPQVGGMKFSKIE